MFIFVNKNKMIDIFKCDVQHFLCYLLLSSTSVEIVNSSHL